ncbi:hypothetical protein BHM03_00043207 [Ensete ventricosum]|nr:hypothetical protein BHM03_00043207 [Ensete ventricosum]
MRGLEVRFHASILPLIRFTDEPSDLALFSGVDPFVLEPCASDSAAAPTVIRWCRSRGKAAPFGQIRWGGAGGDGPLSVSLSVKGSEGFVRESTGLLGKEARRSEETALEGKEEDGVVVVLEEERKNKFKNKNGRLQGAGAGAMNTTKHLWSGATAAMVARIL